MAANRFVHPVFTLLALASLAAWGHTAAAQEKVQLRPNMRPGLSWTFTQQEQVELDTTMSAGGQQQRVTQKISRNVGGRTEVLEASNGVPTTLRFTFDQDSGGEIHQRLEQIGEQTQPLPFALAGQTVTVTIRDGTLSHDFKGLADPQIEQELRALAEVDERFLPEQPVGIGDSWSPDREALARAWQIDPDAHKFDVKITLRELKEVEGRKVAVVEMLADVSGEFPDLPGVSGERHVKGSAVIDVETGRVTRAEANGTIRGSGTAQMEGMDVQMNTQGTMSTRTETQPGAGAGARAGAGAAPAGPANVGGAPPAPAPAPPPAPDPATQSLTGTYTDQKLTLELQEQPGELTGSVTLGGTSYPLKAKRDGARLAGTFTSGGHEFQFTAVWDGQTLRFMTGSTEYQLRKQEQRNPLRR